MRFSHRAARAVALVLSAVLVAAVGGGIALAHGHGHGNGQGNNSGNHHGTGHKGALYVSPSGKTGAADRNCKSAAYSTVQSAVVAASSGGTVVVCRGTYTEDVIIGSPLTLAGQHGAVIHGSTTSNGTCPTTGAGGPGTAPCLAAITIKSSNVTVKGLTVTGAQGEGILATGSLPTAYSAGGSISHVSITGDKVTGNDLGGIPPATTSPYPSCVEKGEVPGDCGEGIHLMSVAHSVVSHNTVSGNSGGILLTDEFGPTHGNMISHNVVTKNLYDCGITAPGHNPSALSSSGTPQPSVAGVYHNTIAHNKITGNGIKGEGAGVLFANSTVGTASYNNLVEFNYIAGNGQSGVTMHAHAPSGAEDLSGNTITHNTFGTNNLDGDTLTASVSDTQTTGILVFSAGVPVTVKITHNRIRKDTYGIWLGVGGHVTASISKNVFQKVGTDVFTSP